METSLDLLNEFFNIDPNKDFGEEVFKVLQKIIPFKSGYIFFVNPKRLEYSFNPADTIEEPFLKEDLKFKNTVFAELIISGREFTEKEKEIFKTCALIIANLAKDAEISKIMKMQIKALQEGYTEIRKINKKIKQSEEVKTKFLSHMSHELRTPLNSILGFSELLNLAGELNDKQREYVNDIKVSGLNLLEMINEILDMSKIESGSITLSKRKFELYQAVNEVLNTLKPLIQNKNIKIKTEINNLTITADYQKFQQILFNLLSNAIKYTKDTIEIKAEKNNEKIVLSIEDNGIGIEKKNLKKVFKKFEQLNKGCENSTGLGLTIVKELIRLHKWKISVQSVPDKGAKFVIEMPSG